MVPGVVGSNPISHPRKKVKHLLDFFCAQTLVRSLLILEWVSAKKKASPDALFPIEGKTANARIRK